MILALFPGRFARVCERTFVRPTVARIASRREKIAVRIGLRPNLKTIYQNHFGVAPVRPVHTAGSQRRPGEAAEEREKTPAAPPEEEKGF